MTAPAFPTSATELNRSTLSALLGDLLAPATISEVHVVRLDEGRGLLGSVHRVHATYDRPNALPATFIAKFPADDSQVAQRAASTDLYRREVRFYQDLAVGLDVNVPTCYAAHISDDGTRFVLLIEDLGDVDTVDQLTGCTPAQARAVLSELAILHARYWNSVELDDLAWIPSLTTPARVGNLTELAERGWPKLRKILAPELTPDHAAIGEQLSQRVPGLLEELDRLGSCLVHGDVRLDNVLFAPDRERPVLVDWQGITRGPAMLDVGYFLVQSTTTTTRRQHLDELIAHYLEELAAQDTGAPAIADALHGIRLAAEFSLIVACSIPILSDTPSARVRALATAMGERSLTTITDLDNRQVHP